MAVAVIVDIPGGNEQLYEQMIAKLFPEGKLPESWLIHLQELVDKMMAWYGNLGNQYTLWTAAQATFEQGQGAPS